MGNGFRKAVKYEQKLRLALCGPTGSGKTYTALMLATEIAGPEGRVALIDTEHGSASLYADRFSFDTMELTTFAPKQYVNAIRAAEEAGYDVCVIDGLSHAWIGEGGALDQVDKAGARGGGNRFTAWRDVTPQHNEMIGAILGSKMHIIATMRSKMEYVMEEGEGANGQRRTTVRKVGMAPVQRDGMEYEFTLVGDLDINHTMAITKSRISELADAVINRPDRDVAKKIMTWLQGAERPAEEPSLPPPPPAPKPATAAPKAENGGGPEERPSSAAQHKNIHVAISAIWGKDERAAYDWVKERCPEACESETEIHVGGLSEKAAATLMRALIEERAARQGVAGAQAASS